MDQFLNQYVFPYTGKFFGWARKTEDGLPIYTPREEQFNTITHIVGILIGIIMVAASFLYARSGLGLAGGLILGSTLIVLYLASSIYHGTPLGHTREKKLLRLMDHCSIFVLVAGTCSPFILRLIGQSGDWTEWFFYGVIWLLALGGIAMLCVDIKKYKSVTIVLYVFMGVLLVLRAGEFMTFLGQDGTALLLAGGIAYLIGLLFYGLGSRHEWMHGVFHVFCLVGSILHCICIGTFVI